MSARSLQSITATPPGGDDLPFVYAGTLVVHGHGIARVTATGPRSEIGRIGAALGKLELELSPLQRQTARLVRTLAAMACACSLLLVLFSLGAQADTQHADALASAQGSQQQLCVAPQRTARS